MEKFVIKKDGKKCEFTMDVTSNGIKMMTKGKDCKKLLGKEHFKEMEIGMGD